MAIQDYLLTFSDGQALTTIGDTDSTNTVKLGSGQDAWGNTDYGQITSGDAILNVVATEAFAMNGGTVTPKLYKSNDGSSWSLWLTGPAATEPSAGDVLWKTPLPAEEHAAYLKLTYTLSTGATAGKVDAWIGLDPAGSN